MGQQAAESSQLAALAVPRAGLSELFRVWTGDGPLLDAIVASDSDGEEEWTPASVRRRSRRVLLGLLEDDLLALPRTYGEWAQYLPLESLSERGVHNAPRGGTRWGETVRRHGWPPAAFVTRTRSRLVDAAPLTTLSWVARKLSDCMADVHVVSPNLHLRLEGTVTGLNEAITQIGGYGESQPPDRSDLLALAHAGSPWRAVSRIAELMTRAEKDLEFLAFSLLEPDPAVESRLFQVSTFGYMITAIRTQGCRILWKSQLGAMSGGPDVEARTPNGSTWDLWFESGSARTYYSACRSTYQSAVASIAGVGSPIRPDMLLIRHPHRALIIECKWSAEPSYVGRDGYHQASSYALDTLNGLATEVWSFVIGPQEVVPSMNIALEQRSSMGVVLGSASVEHLGTIVSRFLQGSP